MQARRQGNRLALLFLDLDHFKDINDSLGHATGDRVLRAAAQRLQEVVGAEHTVARISGDEFTVVLEGLAHPSEADHCAQRIITAFDAPLRLDDRYEFTISPSIGISLYPRPCAGADRPAQARRYRDVPGQGHRQAAPSCATPTRWTATSAAAPT